MRLIYCSLWKLLAFAYTTCAAGDALADLHAAGTALAEVLQQVRQEADLIRVDAARSADLAEGPHQGVQASDCVLDQIDTVLPIVEILGVLPISVISTPVTIIETALKTAKTVVSSLFRPALLLLQTAFEQAARVATRSAMLLQAQVDAMVHSSGALHSDRLTVNLTQMQDLNTAVQASSNADAVAKVAEQAAIGNSTMAPLLADWQDFKARIIALKQPLSDGLMQAEGPLSDLHTVAANVQQVCQKIEDVLAPLQIVNAELDRVRCFAVEGYCHYDMCGSIRGVLTGSDVSDALQDLMQKAAENMMEEVGLDELLFGQLLDSAPDNSTSSISIPQLAVPILPALPVLTAASANVDAALIADGTVLAVGVEELSMNVTVAQVWETLLAMPTTTTLTTTEASLLPVVCKGIPDIDMPAELTQAADDVSSAASDALDTAEDGINTGFDNAKEGVGDGADKAKEGVGDGVDKAKEGVGDGVDKAKGIFGRANGAQHVHLPAAHLLLASGIMWLRWAR